MLTQARLRELLSYNSENGNFTWLASTSKRIKINDIAGCLSPNNYILIRIDRKLYKAHRLVWFYVYGVWPANHIDHIDGNRSNNRICNLRDVDNAINSQNQKRARSDNKCGLLGVMKNGSGFQAQIKVNGSSQYLGTFQTPEDAHEAYLSAKREHHKGCTI
jgi:hypothetical protein